MKEIPSDKGNHIISLQRNGKLSRFVAKKVGAATVSQQ